MLVLEVLGDFKYILSRFGSVAIVRNWNDPKVKAGKALSLVACYWKVMRTLNGEI